MKKTAISLATIIIFVGLAWLTIDLYRKNTYINANIAPKTKTTEPTRQERTKQLINQLTEERQKDPSFIKTTETMQKDLDQKIAEMRQALINERKAQAKIDALFVIKTQYEAEISLLEDSNK